MNYTVDQIMAFEPCEDYPRELVEDLWAGRESLTLAEILHLDIPAGDRVWVATRPGMLTPSQRSRWLDIVVERAIRSSLGRSGCHELESWAKRWLNAEDRSQASARAAARAAAEAAWAESAAAEVAAAMAAAEAAWAESAAAEVAAARAAARAAAEAAWAESAADEREQQVADLLAVITGGREE